MVEDLGFPCTSFSWHNMNLAEKQIGETKHGKFASKPKCIPYLGTWPQDLVVLGNLGFEILGFGMQGFMVYRLLLPSKSNTTGSGFRV